jgi:type I restriction enzyme S subunit
VTLKLDDVCSRITDGKHGDCESEPGSGFYFLSCKDVGNGTISYDAAREITHADFAAAHRRTQLEPHDILITNSGTIGRIALVPDNERTARTTFQKSVAILKPDRSQVSPSYLYYYLAAQMPRLVGFAGGTAQKNLLLRDMRAFVVEMPALRVQRKVAAVLSAYDELLENNNRRITILEELAQMAYRRCFADLPFAVQGPDWAAPSASNDWKSVALEEICSLRRTPYGPSDEALPLLDLARIPRRTLAVGSVGEPGELKTSRIRFEEGDVLFGAIRPYLHKVCLAPFAGVTNTSVLVLRASDKSLSWLLPVVLSSNEAVRWADHHASGTKMPVIKWDVLRSMPVVLPNDRVLARFNQAVAPMLAWIKHTYAVRSRLMQARDLLLPRLISGDIDVGGLDISAAETPA